MQNLDPQIKPQGQVNGQEITKVVEILSQDANAQNQVLQAVQSDSNLASYIQQIISKYTPANQARDINTWEDIHNDILMEKRMDLEDKIGEYLQFKRWIDEYDEVAY